MARQANVIAHWHQLIENCHASSLAFYDSVEAGVSARAIPDTTRTRIEHKEAGLASAKRAYVRLHRGKYAFDICAAPFGNGFFVSWWFTEPPLPFAILYTLLFLFALVICMTITFTIGATIGALIAGYMFGIVLGGSLACFGVPALLWLLGSAMRHGNIPGESTVLAMPLVGMIYERIFAPATYYALDTALMFQDTVHQAVLDVIDEVTTNKGLRALSEAERKPILKTFAASV